jgi:hypothetical protein
MLAEGDAIVTTIAFEAGCACFLLSSFDFRLFQTVKEMLIG